MIFNLDQYKLLPITHSRETMEKRFEKLSKKVVDELFDTCQYFSQCDYETKDLQERIDVIAEGIKERINNNRMLATHLNLIKEENEVIGANINTKVYNREAMQKDPKYKDIQQQLKLNSKQIADFVENKSEIIEDLNDLVEEVKLQQNYIKMTLEEMVLDTNNEIDENVLVNQLKLKPSTKIKKNLYKPTAKLLLGLPAIEIVINEIIDTFYVHIITDKIDIKDMRNEFTIRVHKALTLLLNRHNNIVDRTKNYEKELSDDVKLDLQSIYILMNDEYKLYEVIDKLEKLKILTSQEVRRLKIS